MDLGEKTSHHDCQTQPPQTRHSRQDKKPRRQVALVVCVSLLLLIAFSATPFRLWRGLPCGKKSTERAVNAGAGSTPLTTLLHRYLPGRYQHGVTPTEPEATAVVRLARRQDNTTSSSSEAVPSSTQTASSTTSRPPSSSASSSSSAPPRTSTTSASSSRSSTTSSRRTTTTPTSTRTTTPSSPSPTANPGTSPSSSQNDRAPNPTGSTAVVSSPGARTTPPPSPPPSDDPAPSRVDGGTTLTKITTLPGGTDEPQGQTVTRSSKLVIATLTSTLPNGSIVVVTQTSVVPADPAPTGDASSANTPSLQNDASQPQHGSMALLSLFGVMAGALLA